MATSTARRRLIRRNARLLDEHGCRPAPHTPPPLRKGDLSERRGLKRDNSQVETKRVPEGVGCTVVRLDYVNSRPKQKLDNQRLNNGRKVDRKKLVGADGTIRRFVATTGADEVARKATEAAAARTRKAQRAAARKGGRA